jgi:hypothetical protein
MLKELRFPEQSVIIDDRTAVAISACFNESIIPFIASLLSRRGLRAFLDTDLSRHFTGCTPDKILADLKSLP